MRRRLCLHWRDGLVSLQPMNPSEEPTPTRTSAMSAEALVGLGITAGSLGILFLLLGWAQSMRQVHQASFILLAIGAVLVVIGGLTAMIARSKRR